MPAIFTVMVLLNGPAAIALNPAMILSLAPFAMGASGFTGVVQPHEGTADSITIGASLVFSKAKLCVTGVPCFIFPKSQLNSLNFATSSAFFCCAKMVRSEEHTSELQ